MTPGRSTQPSSVGPYEIRASLGRGGGGEVYRAWDPRLERDVALKLLHEQFENDPERVRRFVAEARAASALNHPNIVTVYDAAVDGGRPYIVSELVDGRPLRDELGRGPMPLKRLLDLATQIADGLAAAHDAGITHRDLKPENIMVTRTGRVKIVDFGLSRAAGFETVTTTVEARESDTQTEAGLISGTVPYMSPEQARDLPSDFHSDQFSFGLILFEMATGRRAFRARDRGRDARRDHQRGAAGDVGARRARARAAALDRQVDFVGVAEEAARSRVQGERPEPVGHGGFYENFELQTSNFELGVGERSAWPGWGAHSCDVCI